jgi:adenine-specific DNA-methyltransferase
MVYVVQTNTKIVERCLLMTTDPGDLVLDPTCGSGTTAYVAEQWGRRWITVDVSRVPLALTRQRLLSATFTWYDLKDEARGPAGGFVYKRKQNKRGEEVGGIVPHVTLRSIANDEPADEEVLVDRPEVVNKIVRVVGPFTVEAVIAPAVGGDGQPAPETAAAPEDRSYPERMLAILRKSPRLALPGNCFIEFANARVPAKSQAISAEAALVNGHSDPVAVVFGPEHGAISQHLVYSAICEARPKGYKHLVVIGFAIEPSARQLIDVSAERFDMPATYAQATLDVTMGDLLKNMKSSQILSVCGSPEVAVKRVPGADGRPDQFSVELLGVDVFNPITMEVYHRKGDDVPAWFLCDDYDDMVFRISQAFFPRTGAWDNLKRSLKGSYDDSLWEHLAGTTSAPFEAGDCRKIAVKVIDDRGNELMAVRSLDEVAPAGAKPPAQPSAERNTSKRRAKR